MVWPASSGTGPFPWLLSNTLPSSSRPSYSIMTPSLGMTVGPDPALTVCTWTVRSRTEYAPYQASATPAPMISRKPSHSFTARPVLAGRWAASATDMVGGLGARRAFALGALALELAGAAD